MINQEIEGHESMSRMSANLTQSGGNPVHFRTQNDRSLMLGYQKGKMTAKPQKNSEKRQRIVLKRLVKQMQNNSKGHWEVKIIYLAAEGT